MHEKHTPPLAQEEPLLSVREAAALAGRSPHTLNCYRSSGTGPAFCSNNGRIAYRRSDVLAWCTETDGLLDTAAAANLIGCSKRHLENLRCHGEGPDFIKLRGQRGKTAVFYRPEDVVAWRNAR